MTNKFLKLLFSSALLLNTCVFFQSCKDDDDNAEPEFYSGAKKVFILNEGSYNANNSSLDIYYPDGESNYQSKVYASVNGEGVGDTGQDIVYYNGRIYLSVFGSNYLAKLDYNGKVLEKFSFPESDGQPRHLAVKDGFVYVSLYSGKIAKFDTTSIASVNAYVDVDGKHPEKIYISGNSLYVAIAGDYTVAYDNRIAVVDLNSFSVEKHITVGDDPTFVEVSGNNAYVIHYITTTWTQELVDYNISSNTSTTADNVAKITISDNTLYYVKSATDWTSNTTSTSFYKSKIGDSVEETEFLDLTSTPELSSATVYLFDIDPENGDFYIGTTDYYTNGNVYRFSKDGKFITKFETSSLSPSKAIFVY